MAVATRPKTTITSTHPKDSPYQLDPDQTLKASRALLQHVKAEAQRLQQASAKRNLLTTGTSDSDDEDSGDADAPIWLTLTTKQHIVDQNRLKPSKICVPHSLNSSPDLRICVITADPQRAVKNIVADPRFPEELKSRITRIIGLTKLKARYKTFEQRRQLLGEHDVFLADDRIITRLPKVLGKVFYKGTSKRPIPIVIASPERTKDDSDKKKKSKDEGAAPPKSPDALSKEIEKAVASVPVSLRPGVLLAVRVGLASFSAEQLSDNIAAVVGAVIEKHVVKGWRNVKGIQIKGHSSFAVPIWLADDLWTGNEDIASHETIEEGSDDVADGGQKRKRNPETTKGPQAGSRKKTKADGVSDAKVEKERDLTLSRKSKLAAQKAHLFTQTV
jgi:ribosome biogenesis protein UTP30